MKIFTVFRRRIRRVRRKRRVKRKAKRKVSSASKKSFIEHKERARVLVRERLEHFNTIYNFKYNKIAIRNQRSRWGSCSKKGNLNFNYRIALLPEKLSDYIIVHELCHIGEFNHSQKFWDLVAKTVPDYAQRRAELRKIRLQ